MLAMQIPPLSATHNFSEAELRPIKLTALAVLHHNLPPTVV